MSTKQDGDWGEALAAEYLEAHGCRIVEREWRCRLGEIDLIAEQEGMLLFVEVKLRTNLRYGMPREYVTAKKQEKLRAAALLRAAGAELNILTVVTKNLCRQAKKVYAYYQKQGFSFQQFILCLEPVEGQRHGVAPTNAEYARFLIDLFDAWYADWESGAYRSVRYFDNLVRLCLGQPAELCSLRGHCSNQLIVEADGSCYPCDFYNIALGILRKSRLSV